VPETEVAEIYYNLGNAYFELNQLDQAIAAYENALALDRSLPQAGYNLARVYIESGKTEEGLAALNELLESDPENSVIRSTIGWAYYLLGDYDASHRIYVEILERTPTDTNALYNAAVTAWFLDDKEGALELYERLYSLNEDAETLRWMASIYMDLERWREAIKHLTVYTELIPDDPDAFYDLGTAYSAERLYGEALAAFENAIQLDPENPSLYFEKAAILLLYIENVDEGIKALEAAVNAGFSDRDKAALLLEAEELIFKEEVRSFLEQQELVEKAVPGEEEQVSEPDTEAGTEPDTETDTETGTETGESGELEPQEDTPEPASDGEPPPVGSKAEVPPETEEGGEPPADDED
jgi:tetratricopeptide (TPR) repeat protein